MGGANGSPHLAIVLEDVRVIQKGRRGLVGGAGTIDQIGEGSHFGTTVVITAWRPGRGRVAEGSSART